ncbi:hypothetical protein [uncultured Photobacterium sp.]|uniref:hypothetical protein n=1 Tax=uncultured Photobacterium sp. TaxID=173973 RepID=UPI0026390E6F|nr:hypothetical protein [uncultured Photobacterium sp.]
MAKLIGYSDRAYRTVEAKGDDALPVFQFASTFLFDERIKNYPIIEECDEFIDEDMFNDDFDDAGVMKVGDRGFDLLTLTAAPHQDTAAPLFRSYSLTFEGYQILNQLLQEGATDEMMEKIIDFVKKMRSGKSKKDVRFYRLDTQTYGIAIEQYPAENDFLGSVKLIMNVNPSDRDEVFQYYPETACNNGRIVIGDFNFCAFGDLFDDSSYEEGWRNTMSKRCFGIVLGKYMGRILRRMYTLSQIEELTPAYITKAAALLAKINAEHKLLTDELIKFVNQRA